MDRLKVIFMLIVAGGIFRAPDFVLSQQFKIMPLGDSITQGVQGDTEASGYRDDLAEMLLSEGISFTMVGTLDDDTGFYPWHEGHPGWAAYRIADNISGWLPDENPNVVLLHIGTNDISSEYSVYTIISEIESIIDQIYNYNYNITVFLASVIPRLDDKNGPNDFLNTKIDDLVSEKRVVGYKIFYSAQNEAFRSNPDWETDYMYDTLHPNDTGYHVMAERFFDDFMDHINFDYEFMISGDVNYYANDEPVPNVQLTVQGNSNISASSDADGYYEFTDLISSQNYTIVAEKDSYAMEDNISDFVITTYSAALTLRHALNLETLSDDQKITADVDRDGYIFSYDAALIARYAVGLPKFPDSRVGDWLFDPSSRSYPAPNSDAYNKNYAAFLLGDVSGAWNVGAENSINRASPSYDVVTEQAIINEEMVTIPVLAKRQHLLSCDAVFQYCSKQLELVSVTKSGLTEDFQLVYNNQDNTLKTGLYSAYPTANDGELLEVTFRFLGTSGNMRIEKYERFDNQSMMAAFKISVDENRVAPERFRVWQNYPNPFNPETVLRYEIPYTGHVSITIYNMLGQQVNTLFDDVQVAGIHNITWNGRDERGVTVAGGAYLCRVKWEHEMNVYKMIKLQ